MPVATFRWIAPAAALSCLLCTPAFAVDGVLEINQACAVFGDGCFPGDVAEPPVTITQPGSYVLTGNLFIGGPNLDAIRIETNDVTLDLNGHTIQGPDTGGGSGNGIYALDRYNITIRNGRIWGFGNYGIIFVATAGDPSRYRSGDHVEAMHISNNGRGITLNGGLLVDSTVDGNRGAGVQGDALTVRSVTASKNVLDGFRLGSSSIMNCTAFGNGQFGFYLVRSSLRGCVAVESGLDGVNVTHSSVTGCRADDNVGSGIGMGLGTTNGGNHVFRNSATGNGGTDQLFCPDDGTVNICVDNATF